MMHEVGAVLTIEQLFGREVEFLQRRREAGHVSIFTKRRNLKQCWRTIMNRETALTLRLRGHSGNFASETARCYRERQSASGGGTARGDCAQYGRRKSLQGDSLTRRRRDEAGLSRRRGHPSRSSLSPLPAFATASRVGASSSVSLPHANIRSS